ncbi:hypothetical protein EON65_35820 [archaeon]|nr:MAG: hypothetical protein EON65_35820 [archaeon]
MSREGMWKQIGDVMYIYMGQHIYPTIHTHILPTIHTLLTYVDTLGRGVYAPENQDTIAAVLTIMVLVGFVGWRMWR